MSALPHGGIDVRNFQSLQPGQGRDAVLESHPRELQVLIIQLSLATSEWVGPSGPNYLQSHAQELHIDAQGLVPSKTVLGLF